MEVNGTAVSGWVGIRDSKLGSDSPVIAVSSETFANLLKAVHAGDVDLSA